VNPRRLVPEIKSDSLEMLQYVHCADLITGTAPIYDLLVANKHTIICALLQEQAHYHKRTSTRTSRDIYTLALAQRRAGSAAHPSLMYWFYSETPAGIYHTPALCHKSGRECHTPHLAQLTSRERRTLVTVRFA
jgi:hypothetical protein